MVMHKRLGGLLLWCGVVVTSSLAVGLAVHAQEGDEFGRTGLYVGAMAAYSFENFDTGSANVSVHGTEGFDLRVGYRAHPNLAIEGNTQYFNNRAMIVRGGPTADLLAWGFWLNAKLYPLTGQVQPYLLLGPGFTHLDAGRSRVLGISRDDNGFSPKAGLGVDGYLTSNIAVTVEASYVFTVGDIENTDHIPVSAGLTYRF